MDSTSNLGVQVSNSHKRKIAYSSTSSLHPNTPSKLITEIDVIVTSPKDSKFLILSKREEHSPLTYDQVVKQTIFTYFQECISSSKVKVFDSLKHAI